jgi:hypothetical protein
MPSTPVHVLRAIGSNAWMQRAMSVGARPMAKQPSSGIRKLNAPGSGRMLAKPSPGLDTQGRRLGKGDQKQVLEG